jgi:hypothetical protein
MLARKPSNTCRNVLSGGSYVLGIQTLCVGGCYLLAAVDRHYHYEEGQHVQSRGRSRTVAGAATLEGRGGNCPSTVTSQCVE